MSDLDLEFQVTMWMMGEPNSGPLQEQLVLLIAEPSVQPLCSDF